MRTYQVLIDLDQEPRKHEVSGFIGFEPCEGFFKIDETDVMVMPKPSGNVQVLINDRMIDMIFRDGFTSLTVAAKFGEWKFYDFESIVTVGTVSISRLRLAGRPEYAEQVKSVMNWLLSLYAHEAITIHE